MIFAPTLGIRDTHLVAEHIPHHSRLLTCTKRVDHRHTAKAIKHLIHRLDLYEKRETPGEQSPGVIMPYFTNQAVTESR